MYLVGASGHAKVIIDILQKSNRQITGLYDKDESIKSLMGYQVFPETQVKENDQLLISIGSNTTRKELAKRFKGHDFFNAIHPAAILSDSVQLGHGTAVMASAVINADTVIRNHVIINTCASVDHDCIIGDYVHIAPNATLCGGITVGEATLVGSGAVISPNIKIGKNVTIGAGAVVINDIPNGATVVGNPAKIVKTS